MRYTAAIRWSSFIATIRIRRSKSTVPVRTDRASRLANDLAQELTRSIAKGSFISEGRLRLSKVSIRTCSSMPVKTWATWPKRSSTVTRKRLVSETSLPEKFLQAAATSLRSVTSQRSAGSGGDVGRNTFDQNRSPSACRYLRLHRQERPGRGQKAARCFQTHLSAGPRIRRDIWSARCWSAARSN